MRMRMRMRRRGEGGPKWRMNERKERGKEGGQATKREEVQREQ